MRKSKERSEKGSCLSTKHCDAEMLGMGLLIHIGKLSILFCLSAFPKSHLNDNKEGQERMEGIGDNQQAKHFHESLVAS